MDKIAAELQRLKNGLSQAKKTAWVPALIQVGKILLVFAAAFLVFVIVSLNKVMNQRFGNK